MLALVAPATAAAVPIDMSGAIAQVEPGVARLDTTINYQHAIGAGTGIVLDPGGAILTNFHVVQGADSITASVGGGSFPADLVGYDRGHDIAVLQLRGAGRLPAAPIGDSSRLGQGDPVVALGNASGSGSPLTQEAGQVVGFGRTISAKDELTGSSEQMTGLIEFAAPVRAGDSGGPLVNAAGQVVGVTTAATVNFRMGPGGEGFAIPDQRRDGDRRPDPVAGSERLGAHRPADPDRRRRQCQRAAARPARASSSTRCCAVGLLSRPGLLDGDVLLTIDGVQLNSATTLTNVLDRHYPGDVVDLGWIDRAGQQRTGKADAGVLSSTKIVDRARHTSLC